MSKKFLTVSTVSLLAIGVLVISLWLVNAQLQEHAQALALTQHELASTQKALVHNKMSILALERIETDLTRNLQTTGIQNQDLQSDVVQQQQRNVQLQQTNTKLTMAHANLQLEKEEVDSQLVASQSDVRSQSMRTAQLTSDLTVAQGQLVSMQQEQEQLISEYQSVQELEKTHSKLESDIAHLEESITALKKQRAPLRLDVDTIAFACTGSMEPKLTCLDSATMIRNFQPEDIVVGTIIGFEPPTECTLKEHATVHRVIQIKVQNGSYYYWTKGDNAQESDQCWIPVEYVHGYVTELHKGTYPENAPLRAKVNTAQNTVDARWAIYDQRYKEYCSHGQEASCLLYTYQMEELTYLYNSYNVAFTYYSCVLEQARGQLQICVLSPWF